MKLLLLLNKFGRMLRIMINKCGFCRYSYQDGQGRLKCPYTCCHLTIEELNAILNLLGGIRK